MRNSVQKLYIAVKKWITVSADFYIGIAAAVLLLPLKWVCAWIFAIIFHELCHFLALRIRHNEVTGIFISAKGVRMYTQNLSTIDEAICAYAGPFGALLLLLFARQMPRVAICVVVQSAFNLLPVYPLDGGRGLNCILTKMFGEERGKLILSVIEHLTIVLFLVLAIYAYFCLGLGLLPALIVIVMMIRSRKINIPCKIGKKALQ